MAQTKTKLTGTATIVREEDLEDMQELERDLVARIDKAREDGRAYMMAQYVVVLAKIKGETSRLKARFDRDSMAAMRKEQKDLKATQRDEQANP